LELLSQLNGYWEPAAGFHTLLTLSDPEEEVLDGIIDMISTAVNAVSDKKVKKEARLLLDKLEQMRKQEREERTNDVQQAQQDIAAIELV